MGPVLRSFITLMLIWCLYSPAYAEMPAGEWEGNGLIQELNLSKGWHEGNIQLSESKAKEIAGFGADHNHLEQMDYKLPVKMLISVDEIVNTSGTVILSTEELSYNFVLRYNPKKAQFDVIWFDRHDQEVEIEPQVLTKTRSSILGN